MINFCKTRKRNTGRWGTTKPQGDKSEFDVLMDNKGIEAVIDGYTEDEGFKWVIDSIEQCIPTSSYVLFNYFDNLEYID